MPALCGSYPLLSCFASILLNRTLLCSVTMNNSLSCLQSLFWVFLGQSSLTQWYDVFLKEDFHTIWLPRSQELTQQHDAVMLRLAMENAFWLYVVVLSSSLWYAGYRMRFSVCSFSYIEISFCWKAAGESLCSLQFTWWLILTLHWIQFFISTRIIVGRWFIDIFDHEEKIKGGLQLQYELSKDKKRLRYQIYQ